ncbi:MAG: L,D-transpeptidase family protein [Verrucomicrobiota bacterium]
MRSTIILALTLIFAGSHAEERVNDPTSFTWNPELSPTGPVVVVVDLKSQKAAVYRNGVQIGACIVSTGMPGHETPTGTFQILEKDADHHSSTYNNASMPYSERLTWGGVALHAGSLPGYPSSHGCIHLPYEFSKKLFEVTSVGGTVIITDDMPQAPVSSGHRIEFSGNEASDVSWTPHDAEGGPVSILFSSSDKELIIVRNGVVIGKGGAKMQALAAKPRGTYTYVCDGWTRDKDGTPHPHFHQVSGPEGSRQLKAFSHIHTDPRLQHAIEAVMNTGATLVITDQPLSDATRSTPGFAIMATAAPKK